MEGGAEDEKDACEITLTLNFTPCGIYLRRPLIKGGGEGGVVASRQEPYIKERMRSSRSAVAFHSDA